MYIDTVWIKRHGSEDDFPELVVAMDEYTAESCEKTIEDLADNELERWSILGDDIAQRRTIRFDVHEGSVRDAFNTPVVKAVVNRDSEGATQ